MSKLKFIYLLLVVFCTSCTLPKAEFQTDLVYDSLSIKIDYPYLPNYPSLNSFYKNDTLYMAAYNHLTHSYDFINLSKSDKHFTIPLQAEGRDGVSASNDIFNLSNGVLVKELTGFKLVGYDGHVLKNIPLTEVQDSINDTFYSISPHGAAVGGYRNAVFDSAHNEMIFPLFPSKNLAFENRILGGRINIQSEKVSILSIPFPKIFNKETLNMGSFFTPQFTIHKDKLIYNFYGFSKFWVYTSSENKIEEFDMPSHYIDNTSPIPPASMNVWTLLKQELITLRFREVYYIEPIHCYVRVHHAPKKNRKDKTVSYLMIMNEKGVVLNEFPLPSSFTEKYFVVGTDMYFLMSGENSENEIWLAKVQLNNKQV